MYTSSSPSYYPILSAEVAFADARSLDYFNQGPASAVHSIKLEQSQTLAIAHVTVVRVRHTRESAFIEMTQQLQRSFDHHCSQLWTVR